jgi:hypothetical protein
MIFLQQLCNYESFNLVLQDHLLEMRSLMKDKDKKVTQEMIEKLVDNLTDIDKVLRDRRFVLTVAAQKGWKVAAELTFYMKGT